MKFFIMLIMSFGLLFASVDINTANADELSSLNSIGSSKAQAIVEYRKGHCFKNINELSLVKGIGAKTVAKNKENMTASTCK